ncbi:MAG: ATP synthase F1 subunit epsilon [Chitinophagales bacterium]|nr:ATP synthase F1 subunit epsilon [Chitinophagales bacterium]
MQLTILTPEKKIFDDEAKGVQLPGIDGSFEILDHHAPIVSALSEGELRINTGTTAKTIGIKSGFVECLDGKVTVLVEGATM